MQLQALVGYCILDQPLGKENASSYQAPELFNPDKTAHLEEFPAGAKPFLSLPSQDSSPSASEALLCSLAKHQPRLQGRGLPRTPPALSAALCPHLAAEKQLEGKSHFVPKSWRCHVPTKGTERAPEQGRQCSGSLVAWTMLGALRTELPASNSPCGTKQAVGFYRICKGPSRLPWDTAWPVPSRCPEELVSHQNGVGEFVFFRLFVSSR